MHSKGVQRAYVLHPLALREENWQGLLLQLLSVRVPVEPLELANLVQVHDLRPHIVLEESGA